MPVNPQELGKGKQAFSYRFQKEHGPAGISILDLQPLALQDNTSLLLKLPSRWYFIMVSLEN